jgi:hypothetical protein
MKTVFTARTATEAHLVCQLLEVEGIESTIRGERLAAIVGEVPCDDSWPQVQVDDADAERAQAVVDGFLENRTHAEGPRWTCAGCGEAHESQFAECWSCGLSRP